MSVAAGADALGFIFVEGTPRYVRRRWPRAIIAALPAFVTPVGVFWDHPAGHVKAVAEECRLGALQFHGDETPRGRSPSTRCRVIKTIKVAGLPRDLAPDGRVSGARRVSCSTRRRAGARARRAPPIAWDAGPCGGAARRRCILSAGLTPDNVADAVRVGRGPTRST